MKRILSIAVAAALVGLLSIAPASAQNCSGQPAANTVCAGPSSGGGGLPSFRALVPADAPPLSVGATAIINGTSSATSRGVLFNKNGILGDSANDATGGPLVINNTGFALRPFVNTEIPALVLSGSVDNATTNETILHFDTYGANANGTIVFSKSGGGSINTGSIAGSVLTVTAQSYGSIVVNQIVMAPGLAAGTTITSFGSGAGGTGTYNLSSSATVGSTTILTNDSPLFPTATKDQQGMGFIATNGWYGSAPATRAFGSAFIKFRADGDFTASSWPTAIDLKVNAVGSTTGNVAGLTVGSNAVVTVPSVVLAANTSGDGIVISSPTAATAGNQQYSPGIRQSGSGWKTNATAGPQPVDSRIYLVPVQGAANPTATLFFDTQINGGGYVSQARLTSGGIFNVTTGHQISGAAPNGQPIVGDGTKGVFRQLLFADLGSTPTTLSGYGITSPLPFVQGGNADTGTAATSFSGTLAPSCGSATFSISSARSKLIAAKITWFQVNFTITAIGTCAGNNITFTLPSTTQSSAAWGGQEVGVGGTGFSCKVGAASTGVSCQRFDGSLTWAVNFTLSLAGTYENQ